MYFSKLVVKQYVIGGSMYDTFKHESYM